jgi:hypothetical protein
MTEPSGAEPNPATTNGAAATVDSRSTDITAGPGGVMTDEVGVVTGELTLRTELAAEGAVRLLVQYREAEEWYAVTGGSTTLHDPSDLASVHELAVGVLHRPNG